MEAGNVRRDAPMTELDALQTCTHAVNDGRLLGYFGMTAAHTLVGTGKYRWGSSGVWGYILERKP